MKRVLRIIERTAEWNALSGPRYSVFHIPFQNIMSACGTHSNGNGIENHVEDIRRLLEMGYDPNSRVWCYVSHDSEGVMRTLLQAISMVFGFNKHRQFQNQVMKLLIDHGATIKPNVHYDPYVHECVKQKELRRQRCITLAIALKKWVPKDVIKEIVNESFVS